MQSWRIIGGWKENDIELGGGCILGVGDHSSFDIPSDSNFFWRVGSEVAEPILGYIVWRRVREE